MDCAWATLVMRSDLYACGALALGASLRRARTQAELVCMVTDDIPADVQEALLEVWDHVVEVPRIEARVRQREQRRFGLMYDPWLHHCLTKFSVLAMRQFRKVAFLDADMPCVAWPTEEPCLASAPPWAAGSTRRQVGPWAPSTQPRAHRESARTASASEAQAAGVPLPERISACHGVEEAEEPSKATETTKQRDSAEPMGQCEGRHLGGGRGVTSSSCREEHVDDLFLVPTPAGVLDLYKKDLQKNTKQHGRPVPTADVRRALSGHFYAMRGCILLLEPDPDLLLEIRDMAQHELIGNSNAMAGPDEYFITRLFLERGVAWHHLHFRYGMVSWAPAQLSLSPWFLPPVFLHYVSEKPWAHPASAGNPKACQNSADNTSQNWEDFRHWDEVVRTLVLPGLPTSLADRLFQGWRERVATPYVPTDTVSTV